MKNIEMIETLIKNGYSINAILNSGIRDNANNPITKNELEEMSIKLSPRKTFTAGMSGAMWEELKKKANISDYIRQAIEEWVYNEQEVVQNHLNIELLEKDRHPYKYEKTIHAGITKKISFRATELEILPIKGPDMQENLRVAIFNKLQRDSLKSQ